MIGEGRVHVWEDDTGHVAGDAILLADGTSFNGMAEHGILRWRRNMTSQALLVIGACIMDKRLVRVVASGAGKTRIAVKKPPAWAAIPGYHSTVIGLEN